jgi:hypothetical protein
MMGLLLAVSIGGALIWMLMPRKPRVRPHRSHVRSFGNPGWLNSGAGGSVGFPGGSAPSSVSADCSSGFSGDGGGSCGGD